MANRNDLRETIYAEYFEKVTNYVCSHVENLHDREDVVGDVFLKIYAKLDNYDETKASLSTWIYAITKNTVIDYYRSRKIFDPLPELRAAEEGSDLDGDLHALTEALGQLDERGRDLITLHYYSGYTLKSIADMMSISYVYAKVLHKKALAELERLMGG